MKYIKGFVLFILLFKVHSSIAIESVDFKNIPENLKIDANAIIRFDKTEFEVVSEKKGILNKKFSVTVLNKNGDEFANLYVYYDKFIKVSDIKGTIYNSNGELLRKIKSKEIIDQSISQGSNLFDDNRVKYIELFEKSYPYTVEYEYTLIFDGFISIPGWKPVYDYNVSVEKSEYLLKVDSSYRFHYKTINCSKDPVVTQYLNQSQYLWSIENFNAITSESFSPAFSEITPTIYIAPYKFFFDGSWGSQENWEDYGRWVYDLLKGRDKLSEETLQKINLLTKNIDNPIDKTRVIYEYMQSKTRYVSIQLGIGGFQPFSALDVDQYGYGDCKALVNYTKALLKGVGIDSYYTEVYGGRQKRKFYIDFPGISQTNHIILCVPFEKDTIWLECTDQKQPFGYLGTFTDDRYAILITPEGGKLKITTNYDNDVNTQNRTIHAKLNNDLGLIADISSTLSGIQYDNISDQLLKSSEDQKKHLYRSINSNNFTINSFNYHSEKEMIPTIRENLNLFIKDYSTTSGKRIFLTLNILNKQEYIPKKTKQRKNDIVINNSFIDTDTIYYEIPPEYKIEYIPDSTLIESVFGTYKSSIFRENNKITYIRVNRINKGIYSPELYNDLIDHYTKISKADNQKVIFVQ